MVLNLLVNAQQALAAAEAAGPRRIKLSTGVEARRSNREPRVWLRVADNGPGVPPALHETVFEPFFTTKPEGIGTGLGWRSRVRWCASTAASSGSRSAPAARCSA